MISWKLSAVSKSDAYWFIFFSRLLVLAAIFVLISAVMSRLVIARGESVPYTLFLSFPGSTPDLGDYVTGLISHPIIGDEPALLIKKVACDAGQFIALSGDVFECDGQPLGGFITETWDGKPLKPWSVSSEIPDGRAFIMGNHERSFDSRYFGLVDKQELTVVKALF